MSMRYSLATLVAMFLLVVPAHAWEVRVSVVGSGLVDETTPADKLYCSSSQNTPNWVVGATCLAGTPDGDYAHGWTVRYVATPSIGWQFVRWQSDGSTREGVKCDGANGSTTYTGTACQFGTFNNYQTQAVFEDVMEPVPSITGGPAAGATSGRAVSFGFTATNNPGQTTTFTCRLTRGVVVVQDWTGCTSGKGYSSLEHGAHKFEVRATDPSGLTNLTERTWNVDATPPETTLASDGPPPGSLTNVRTATFQFSGGADATKYHCRIDSGATPGTPFVCGSPYTTPVLQDGTYTFRVWGEDAVGNVESSHATRTWTIDGTPPDTTLTGGPAEGSQTEATSATFTLGSEPGATFRCSLDGATPTTCTSPHVVSGLGTGAHTLTVFAVDAAGNADASPATRSWSVVDVTPPETTISSGPGEGASTTEAAATFTFSSENGATFRCSLDGAPASACASPHTVSGLSPGEHTLKVWASDTAGNEDATPATRTWSVVDLTPPDTSITSGPAEGSSTEATSATFRFTSEAGATFRCSLDGAAPVACTSPHTVSGLPVGEHTLEVSAVDASGNEDLTPATRTWKVTGPTIVNPPVVNPPVVNPPVVNPPVVAPAQMPVRLSVGQKARRRHTTLTKLTLSGLPAGSAVSVRCRGKRCPVKRFARTAGGTLKLTRLLRRKLPAGTRLEVTVTRAGFVGKRFTLTIRAGKRARLQTACLHPGEAKPRAC